MKPRYLLGSGYFNPRPNDGDPFVRIWGENLIAHTKPKPVSTVIISVGGSWRAEDDFAEEFSPDVIQLSANLGHVHNLIGKEEPFKPHDYCGWSASVLALAMLAYNDEADFVYREADCLCFGPYIEQMYRELGDGQMIFGNYPKMPCAQSLFLVKHAFIPTFVCRYLSLPSDRVGTAKAARKAGEPHLWLPENKFARLEFVDPRNVRRFKFGCDRARPIPFNDPVFYAQQLTAGELHEMRTRGMI